ncbi:MAG: type IV secretion system DNA-binding domain-containing protein [Candidatus Pacebacteria bacterium]|nr:type IV secretion system DNA-binding domain-containing protein [Candidatus Paceibacterota bacterium]
MDVPYNKEITYIAKTHFRNNEKVFGIKKKDRRQHMYVLGKSGTGKSALLYNMIIQNIANGEGVCVVDPHGELVEDVLRAIPADRIKDVIYFNPADVDFHIGFNVLELPDPQYKHLVASGLMSIFTKMWANTWSARMEYILNNAILALLDTPGTTLLGIPRLLVDKDYRQQIVSNLKDPVVKTFWIHEYEAWQDKFRNEAIAPIQNKVGQFLSTSIIRNVVGQSKSTMDIFDIMNSGKIFLVNVSKGRIGEDNSSLLGGMLITKIQLAAMERVRIPEPERRDFYLYVDEFQNFVTDSFASILSEARKYRLNLIIAHQYTAQLKTQSGDVVRDAVFGNVGTMIVFRVGAEDADFLEKEFMPEFLPEDIVAQPNYHVYLKLMVDGITSRPFSAYTLPPMRIDADVDSKEKVIINSREMYAKPKEEIEQEINDWSGLMGGRDSKAPEGKWKATCSACGKEVSVPFEPQEGRSVYCKEDMQKIKDGTLKPVKNFKINPRKQIEANDALASLGIEFQQQNSSPERVDLRGQKTTPQRPAQDVQISKSPSFSSSRKSDEEKEEQPKEILKPSIKRKPSEKYIHTKRKSPDYEDLGKVLTEALQTAGKQFPAKHIEPVGVEKPKQERVSLSMLKSTTPTPRSGFSQKEQSNENKDELRKVLASITSKKYIDTQKKIHEHTDSPIQEQAILKVIELEDQAFHDGDGDTLEEIHEHIDKEQERQEVQARAEKEQKENKEYLEKQKKEKEDIERLEKEKKLKQQTETQAQAERDTSENAKKLEQEKLLQEKQKEQEEKLLKKDNERKEAESWLANQKERRVGAGAVVSQLDQTGNENDEESASTLSAQSNKKKKEVPEDLLRQILK